MGGIILVNDKMQSGYRYSLAEPVGTNFDPEFEPELTPKKMLQLGVFCGKYMTDTRSEFPEDWFRDAKLAAGRGDCSLNYFGVDARLPISIWRRRGWIHPDDPRGWCQWYCRYYMGRRIAGRIGDRSGGGKPSAGICGRSKRTVNRAISLADADSAKPFSTGLMMVGKSERIARGRGAQPIGTGSGDRRSIHRARLRNEGT